MALEGGLVQYKNPIVRVSGKHQFLDLDETTRKKVGKIRELQARPAEQTAAMNYLQLRKQRQEQLETTSMVRERYKFVFCVKLKFSLLSLME